MQRHHIRCFSKRAYFWQLANLVYAKSLWWELPKFLILALLRFDKLICVVVRYVKYFYMSITIVSNQQMLFGLNRRKQQASDH